MDVISLALALKALKNSSGGEGGSDIDFIHEVDNLNITESETGIYKVNGITKVYNDNGSLLNVPNVDPSWNAEITTIVIVSKYFLPKINRTIWKWVILTGEDSVFSGLTVKNIDADTQEASYQGTIRELEKISNKINVINNTNKDNQTQYPSVKAVADYVDNVLADITETQY